MSPSRNRRYSCRASARYAADVNRPESTAFHSTDLSTLIPSQLRRQYSPPQDAVGLTLTLILAAARPLIPHARLSLFTLLQSLRREAIRAANACLADFP